ncbi:hypothetical protein GP486_000658 [Trichoglossum hirsutum]|uniref:Uncharacterized protein n=1 Tax=Trichoglossum hirsutum TaxID=265104 RepID=A0A9P8RTS0_9PEZI|nr:hypothetical protein GP486_000658 [Trichoglossum hirsutum]
MEKKDEITAGVREEAKTAQPSEPAPENVSDLEEENLDDLDDMLDEFSTAKIDEQEKAPLSSGPGRPPDALFPTANDDFAKELQKGMEDLLDKLGTSVGTTILSRIWTGS